MPNAKVLRMGYVTFKLIFDVKAQPIQRAGNRTGQTMTEMFPNTFTPDPLVNVIARKLRAIRAKGAIRSIDIASMLEIRPETVSRWNHGKAFPRRRAQKQLLELEYVIDQLAEYMQPLEIRLWIFSRQKKLAKKTPGLMIHLGRTDKVLDLIDQLRAGGRIYPAQVPGTGASISHG